jgi:glycosyltransferase involved in cell wall biosynthesis
MRPPVRIEIQGPFETSFSLALANRSLALALDRQPGVKVTLRPTQAPGHGVDHHPSLERDPELHALCRDDADPTPAALVLRSIYPPRLTGTRADQVTGVWFAWEDSLVPGDWADAFNRNVDLAIVPSHHVRRALWDSGVAVPIAVVPYGIDPAFGRVIEAPPLDLDTRKRIRFLHVSSGLPRKACDVLIRAFCAEFTRADDVCLVVKTLPQFDHDVATRIRRARYWRLKCPEIVHLDRDLDLPEMLSLYRSASCLVHPARAEGFGLPVAEAMLAGLPVIVTRHSGPLDFCDDHNAWLIDGRLVASRSPFTVPNALWLEPDERQLRAAMRTLYCNLDAPEVKARVARARADVGDALTWDRAATGVMSAFHALELSSARQVRAGMVTTWNVRCGIAEYSRALIESLPGDAFAWTLLAAEGQAIRPDGPNVARCWRLEEPDSLAGLAAEAASRQLELVHFQLHLKEIGPRHAEAIAALRRSGVRVFGTLHSTREASPGPALRSTLELIDRVFVHTCADRLRLEDFGLRANVTVLPPGCAAFAPRDRADARRALAIQGSPVVATFGFLRPHKGVLELIQAMPMVRTRFPAATLLGLSALYPDSGSEEYEHRCREAARRLGLEAATRLVTEFLSFEEIFTGLHASDVVVLPYHRTIDSASAAVRVALASGRPVVATRQPVFDDVSSAVHVVDRPSPKAIARGILHVLEDADVASALVRRASERVAEDAWARIGRAYARIVWASLQPSD